MRYRLHRKQIPKLCTFALLLLFVGFAFQFSLSPALAEKSPNEILAGVHRDFHPQYSIDEKTGKPAGFAIETMDELARRAGLNIHYIVFNDWPLMNGALKEGRIDIIPNIGIVKDRTADMDFTIPLETYNISIFVRSTTTDIQSIDSLQGRKVAVVTFNIGLSIIQEYGKAIPVIFKSLDEAFLSLLSGNSDALVYPEPSVFLVARRSKLETHIKTVGKPLLEIKRAAAVGKGKTELLNRLNKEISAFIATPEYAKIYAKWHGTPEPYWNARRVLITSGTIFALIIIIFIAWHFLSLIRLNRNLLNAVEKQQEAEEAIRQSRESAERMAEEMAIIAEIGRVVGSTLDLNQVYERVAAETRKLIPYDRLLVNRKMTPEGQFMAAYVSGIDNPRRRVGDLYPSQGSATGVVMNTRTGILIQPMDAEEIKDLYPNLYETFKTGLRSTMSIPLISMDEVIGSMSFRSEKLKAYTEKDLLLAERIGMQVAGAIANAQLFTDLQQAEKSVRESELKYRLLIEYSSDVIFCVDQNGEYKFTNQIFATTFGRTPEYFIGKTFWDVYPKEHADYRQAVNTRVFETGLTQSAEVVVPLPDRTLYFIAKANPVKDDNGKVILNLTHATDITERKRAEQKLQNTLESLRKAVNTTIQVMVSAVETRDPYTSGHQTRSADLARAIAMEMGLPQEKIDAIRMAGSIHDIGKLSIPAEILSKPTKLSEIEFSLIKEHAKKGFEMLKDVESPWPLAEIVHQHHERMDGSGYPRNLKGDDLLMEARILAVADVVEAMASHRPYRPGLGIDAALNEIEKNRGTIYDDAAADACLRLFREKRFQLEGI